MTSRTTNIGGGTWINRIPSSLIILSIAILILSTLDAFFTANLYQIGLEEANPLMDFFITKSIILFYIAKTILILAAMTAILYTHAKRTKTAYIVLISATILYLVVNINHLNIIYNII